jgi:hypothetical protein
MDLESDNNGVDDGEQQEKSFSEDFTDDFER